MLPHTPQKLAYKEFQFLDIKKIYFYSNCVLQTHQLKFVVTSRLLHIYIASFLCSVQFYIYTYKGSIGKYCFNMTTFVTEMTLSASNFVKVVMPCMQKTTGFDPVLPVVSSLMHKWLILNGLNTSIQNVTSGSKQRVSQTALNAVVSCGYHMTRRTLISVGCGLFAFRMLNDSVCDSRMIEIIPLSMWSLAWLTCRYVGNKPRFVKLSCYNGSVIYFGFLLWLWKVNYLSNYLNCTSSTASVFMEFSSLLMLPYWLVNGTLDTVHGGIYVCVAARHLLQVFILLPWWFYIRFLNYLLINVFDCFLQDSLFLGKKKKRTVWLCVGSMPSFVIHHLSVVAVHQGPVPRIHGLWAYLCLWCWSFCLVTAL